ncbi:MAG: GNAT family N-acetyltransferase [Bacteroidales bacterium]|jgi:ribosomal protein S18 acetylase RimI-like enzyme|nr:GNAT family N-acetyltransferase [Bacteroidales bacterium]
MNNSTFLIYEIDESHIPVLTDIAIRTFDETFADTNDPEDMKNYNERCFTAEVFKKEMQSSESWFYFIEYEGKVAGFLKVNVGDAQTELRETDGFELERIYVLKEFHGTGVGAALMDFSIKRRKEEGKKYLWLGVFEENYRAQRFYQKYGLEVFDDQVFKMGKTPQRDVLMRVRLGEGERG